MTMFYALAARLSGVAAVVCAALAVLASPALSRADDPIDDCIISYDCSSCCLAKYDFSTQYEAYMKCAYGDCLQQSSQCPSIVKDKKYSGCKDAGKSCTSGSDPGNCGDSPNKSQCNCNKS